MRNVTITKLGSPTSATVAVTVQYNGPEFEFFAPDVLRICRRAAAAEGGILREDNLVAEVFENKE
jgi:hypothetical protein